MEAASIRPRLRTRLAIIGLGLATLLVAPSTASAGVDAQCPPVADKPDAIPSVNYQGMQQITYCYGPITIAPGQNIIKYRSATDPNGQELWPQVPGYITRFDPDLILADGSVPRVDVTHLHHGVWLVDRGPGSGSPQFAAGEEKTIMQLPDGFGWPSDGSDTWILNDMLHDLIAKPAQVYVTWKIDFVPATSPDYADIKPVRTQWMDVAGNPSLYPVFDSLRGRGQGGEYTFPDDAPAADKVPCGIFGRAPDSGGCLGAAQSWTVPAGGATLIQTAGHLHPGGLNTELRARRPSTSQTNSLFTSVANYYEAAGAVSWDVSMGATPNDSWRVKVQAGDRVSVHATYDSQRADWYEVMGIMFIAVYNGTDVGGVDAMSPSADQPGELTHSHLAENDNHGGEPTGAPNPLALGSAPDSDGTIPIQSFAYRTDPSAGPNVPTIEPGQSLTFRNDDAIPAVNAFHTITSCKEPCNGATGIAYPVADGPVTFDSGELGFNGNMGSIGNAPAAGRSTWKTPPNLGAGTYTYFCRVHPFMRGAFRVEKQNGPVQALEAQPKQKVGSAAITATLDKPATLTLQAVVKSAKTGKAGSPKKARSARVLSDALDASVSPTSLAAKAKTEIKLTWSKSVRKKLKAKLRKGKRWKVVVTATATDKFGKTSESEVSFRLVG